MFKPVSALPKRQTNLVGREGIRWEDQLAALKSAPGEFYIIFEYNYTTDEEGARKTNLCGSKAGSIRRRLDSHDPDADWEILVRRDVPNNHVGIYAKYIGEMTEEKRSVKAERRAKYAERSRAAKQANRNQDEQDD